MIHPLKIAGAIAAGLCCVVASAAEPPAVIHIPGERVVPESLSSDARGYIYIGSMATGTLFRVEPGSDAAQPWIEPATSGLHGMLGVLTDELRNVLEAQFRAQRDPTYQPKPFRATAVAVGQP